MGYETNYELSCTQDKVKAKDTPLFKALSEFLGPLNVEDEHITSLIKTLKPFLKPAVTYREVMERLQTISGYYFEIREDSVFETTGKWYNSDKDMLKLSKEFPNITFTLNGDGEEQGDVWRRVYKNGETLKSQKAKMVFEDN